MNDEEVNMAYNQEFFGVLKEMISLNRKLQADLDKAVECIEKCDNITFDYMDDLEGWQIREITRACLDQLNKDK